MPSPVWYSSKTNQTIKATNSVSIPIQALLNFITTLWEPDRNEKQN